jgi:hypothetical protein
MMTPKPYTPPQIFQVELNQHQAILATCSTTPASISTGSRSGCSSSCRRSTRASSSAIPAS